MPARCPSKRSPNAPRASASPSNALSRSFAQSRSPTSRASSVGDAEKLTLTASGELDKADKPAIAEIIASAKDKKIYRVKLHDKTPALALLTRILEKFVKQDEQTDDDGEEARQFLLEELDRLAAEVVAEEGDREVAAGDPVAG